jgi:predicted Zn-dependent protease
MMFIHRRTRYAGCLVACLGFVTAQWVLQGAQASQGLDALYAGHYRQAAAFAAVYLRTHPSVGEARILLARAQMGEGKYDEAYQNLVAALKSQPRNIDVLYYLGKVSTLLAQQQFQRLYSLAPDSARVHQLMGESYENQGRVPEAIREYQAGLKLKPHSVALLNALGDLERSQYHFDEAITYYSRASEIDSRDYGSAYGLGAAFLYKQQPQQAAAYLRRAAALAPQSPVVHLALGDAFLRAGQASRAVPELKAALRLEPHMRQAYTLLAQAYEKLGADEAAQKALREANRLTKEELQTREEFLMKADPLPEIDSRASHTAPSKNR